MPIGVFKTVREVSSEDTVHFADNLLKQQPGKKWKTKTNGEKCAYVILEFEEPQQVTGIDIGNEYAAFIEVLVSKTGCSTDDFTEILITSSFMTPIESKNGTNTNRVRCFNKDALVASTLQEKWKLVKVICVQPFNKHVQYGLSFIKVQVLQQQQRETKSAKITSLVPEKFLQKLSSPATIATESTTSCNLGKFKFRQDSTDSESDNALTLFKRWQKTRNSDGVPTTAASIREASTPAAIQRHSVNKHQVYKIVASTSAAAATNARVILKNDETRNDETKILNRNRERLLFGEDGDEEFENNDHPRKQRLSKQIELEREQLRQAQAKLNNSKEKHNQKRTSLSKEEKPSKAYVSQNRSTERSVAGSSSVRAGKRLSSPRNTKQQDACRQAKRRCDTTNTVKYYPFNQLLRNVVLVISGIQNPDRSELRRKALELGAKYKTDWSQGCTHLICAFKNTPKYNQVRGRGKIVTRSWIEKCYTLRKYLPWRRYALDNTELAQPESDVELVDETLRPTERAKSVSDEDDNDVIMLGETALGKANKSSLPSGVDQTQTSYDRDDNEMFNEISNNSQKYEGTSGSDTEDELARVAETLEQAAKNIENAANATNISPTPTYTTRDIYEVTTEEEDYLSEKQQRAKQFFKREKFYIYTDISAVDRIKLEQFIQKYGGVITAEVTHAAFGITNEASKTKPPAPPLVRPLWIYECNDLEMRVPEQRYLL